MTGPMLWSPSPARRDGAAMTRLMRTGGFASYGELHRWSVEEPGQFWYRIWEACGVQGTARERAVEPGPTMAHWRFFPDAQLSVVENLLARRGSEPAVIALDETGNRSVRSWDELHANAAAAASALAALGVGAGDRVAAYLPNGIAVIEAMLGAASLGAMFSSCSPDFGTQGVLDRFGQIAPKVFIATKGYHYGGRWFDVAERASQIAAALDTAPIYLDEWDGFVASGRARPLAPQRFAFDHPWYVLYSSGTTGVPKCIVHRAGGGLLQQMKEHQLHCDIGPGDRVLYFTTTGWMMWNWLVTTLASGATVVCYDGSPFHPSPNALFDIVEREQVTLLGVSAKYIDSLRKAAVSPLRTHEMASLRTICSTGSPLSIEGFEYIYESVARDVHLASISGGTDLFGCFVAGDPTSPVYAGEIQRPALGMAVDVWDDEGRSLAERPGVAGELVCTKPFPSMPLGFWADGTDGPPVPGEPGPRYLATYFERFPGVWAHGDFASWTVHGGMIIHGRSDATLNPGGVRIGTAEIYRAVESLPEVMESLVFAQQWEGDQRIVLLVVLRAGTMLTEALRTEIRSRIRSACSPRHVPAVVAAVDDLPRTRSNKLAELAVADAVNGRPVRNTEALANPEAIAAIVALAELIQ